MDAIAAMLNIFIDPKAAVDRFVGRKWAWIWPVLVMGVVSAIIGILTAPITAQVMQTNPPQGMSAEQARAAGPMIQKFSVIASVFSPVIIAVIMTMSAGILMAACSVMDIRAKFGDVYNLIAFSGLVGFLRYPAGFVVVYLRRDDLQSMAELQPGFGLDLLLSEESSKLLRGVLTYFSIFTIWYIVILVFAFAYMTKVSKGKSFAATAPVWILGMIFTVVGTLFQQR